MNLPAVRDRDTSGIQNYSISDISEMAKGVARSRMFGMDESQAFTLMLIAQAKGLHPIQACERYHVIQGRPAMKADAMLADFLASGGTVEWHQHDHAKCDATFTAPGVKTPTRISWSIDDAKKAELTKNPMYSKYPRQMLRSRVISEGIRMTMPGIIAGIYTPEEVSDFSDERRSQQVIDVESRPASYPQNGTDYGRGQYASPDQVKAYVDATASFVSGVNSRWLDEWQQEDGSVPDGIHDLVRAPQLTGHLLKWGLRTERLAPVGMTFDHETGKPTERVSVDKANKYVAILFAREPDALEEEAEAYCRHLAEEARAEWVAKHEAGETSADPEDAELVRSEAGARG